MIKKGPNLPDFISKMCSDGLNHKRRGAYQGGDNVNEGGQPNKRRMHGSFVSLLQILLIQ